MALTHARFQSPSVLVEETVTPDMARRILSENTMNRKVKKRHLEDMARAFAQGRMRFNGETIKIAKTGRLLDGQHRLLACVQTGIPFQTVIVRGLDEDVFDTIDIGSKRTSADVLSIDGVKNAGVVSGAVRWIMALQSENPMTLQNITPDPDEVRDFVYNNSGIEESALVAIKMRGLVRSQAMTCGLHFVLSKIDTEEAELYFYDLIEGASLTNGDPALVARNTIVNGQGGIRSRGALGILSQCAVLVRGWNARIARRNVVSLKGVIRGASGQYIFPEIVGLHR